MRTVHASNQDGYEVVHYPNGVWRLERAGSLIRKINVQEAANTARKWVRDGGKVHLEVPGGSVFDKLFGGRAATQFPVTFNLLSSIRLTAAASQMTALVKDVDTALAELNGDCTTS